MFIRAKQRSNKRILVIFFSKQNFLKPSNCYLDLYKRFLLIFWKTYRKCIPPKSLVNYLHSISKVKLHQMLSGRMFDSQQFPSKQQHLSYMNRDTYYSNSSRVKLDCCTVLRRKQLCIHCIQIFLGSFQTPLPIKSDIIYGRSLRSCGRRLTSQEAATKHLSYMNRDTQSMYTVG